MAKTAIIGIGGGMRSAHGAGFLYALAVRLRLPYPDMVVGSSGNAANLAYYATRREDQCEAMRHIWSDYLSSASFISFLRFWRIMNIDYLIDGVIKDAVPLDVGALEESATEYYIAIVDATSGEARYVGKNEGIDVHELLRASKALPFFYGKTVATPWGMHLDGAVGNTIQSYIDCAVGHGANRILIIDDSSRGSVIWNAMVWLYTRATMPTALQKNVQSRKKRDSVYEVPQGTRVLHVRPDDLPTKIATSDRQKIEETFQCGIRNAIAMEETLRTLFAPRETGTEAPLSRD